MPSNFPLEKKQRRSLQTRRRQSDEQKTSAARGDDRETRGRDKTILILAVLLFGLTALVFVLPTVASHGRHFISPPIPDSRVRFQAPMGDFWIYWIGTHAWMQGFNPYLNSDIRLDRFNDVVFKSHPSPHYAEWVKQNFADNIGITKGYVATPVNLWLLAPLASMPLVAAALVWFLFSAGVLTFIAAGLAWTLTAGFSGCLRAAAVLLALTVFLGMDGNVGRSLFIGQIDSLYMAPMAVAIGLLSSSTPSIRRELAAGVALGLATAVKIFPGLIVLFLFLTALLDSYGSGDGWIDRAKAFARHSAARVAGAAVGTLIFILAVTTLAVSPATVGSWWQKLPSQLTVMTPEAQHFPDAVHYLRYWAEALDVAVLSQAEATWLILPGGALLCGITALAFRRAWNTNNPGVRVLGFGLIIALLPTVFYFNLNYCVVMMIPLIAGARMAFDCPTGLRRKALAVLAVGFMLINYQLVEGLLSAVSPAVLRWWQRSDELMRAWDRFLPNRSDLAPILQPFVSPANLVLGYPGTLVIFIGCRMLLRTRSRES